MNQKELAHNRRLIRQQLKGRTIVKGMGTKEAACTISHINLALTGRLTDEIPECMSSVIGRWIIIVQDAMPDEMRNSKEWRQLIPYAAGTGRGHEQELSGIILEWMWTVVLPSLQSCADSQEFGGEWRTMTTERTSHAATAAAYSAYSAAAVYAYSGAYYAARAAAHAAAATWAADAAAAAYSAAYAAYAARGAAADDAAWATFNPPQLLARLITATNT